MLLITYLQDSDLQTTTMIHSSFFKRLLVSTLATVAISASATPKISEAIVLESENPELNAAIVEIIASRQPVDDFGVVLANIHDFAPELRSAAKKELQSSDRLQIISLAPGSVADEIGLEIGDQLLQINSFYVSRGRNAIAQFSERVEPSVKWNEPLKTTVIRDGYGQNHSTKAL